MRSTNITIDIEEKDNDRWYGEVYDGGKKLIEVIGFFQVRENTTFENQDPRSITLKTRTRSDEKGELLGYLNFKEIKNGNFKIFCRELRIPGTALCFPVDGWLNVNEISNKQQTHLKQDNYYLEKQKKHWEGKRDYVFHDPDASSPVQEDEFPF